MYTANHILSCNFKLYNKIKTLNSLHFSKDDLTASYFTYLLFCLKLLLLDIDRLRRLGWNVKLPYIKTFTKETCKTNYFVHSLEFIYLLKLYRN